MNFNFTKLKVIYSLIISVATTLIIYKFILNRGCIGGCPVNYTELVILDSTKVFVFVLILVYIIWSLIQKKK
jgi:hypothetical protein